MPTLIPDFAQSMTESNRRTASAIDEEIRRVEDLRLRIGASDEHAADWGTLRRRVSRKARAATRELLAEASEMSESWKSLIETFRAHRSSKNQTEILDAQINYLRSTVELARSLRDVKKSVCDFWNMVEKIGGTAENSVELAEAEQLIESVLSEATKALEIREHPWQPADPARFERGLREAQAGQALGPEQTRAQLWKTAG